MPTLARCLGLLVALPFVPLAYAVSLLRAVARGPRAEPQAVKTTADLSSQALSIVQRERSLRGLEPLECSRIDISYGDGFDELRIQFGAETLADGAAAGMQLMGGLGNFEFAPGIARTIAAAHVRARVQAFRGMP